MASTQNGVPSKQNKLIGLLLILVQVVFFVIAMLGKMFIYDSLIFVMMVIFMGAIITIFAIKTKMFELFWTSNFYILFSLIVLFAPYLGETTFYIFSPLMVLNVILPIFLGKRQRKNLTQKADG